MTGPDPQLLADARDCEALFGALSRSTLGRETVSNLATVTKIERPRVIDLLVKMEERGAVVHHMAYWSAVPVHGTNLGTQA